MTQSWLREEWRALWQIAWPAALGNMQWIALNAIDTTMVGHAGVDELSYMGAGRILIWITVVVGMGLLSGVSVFTARAIGAGEDAQCGSILRQGLVFAGVIGIANTALLLLGTRPILVALGLPANMVAGGTRFVAIMAWVGLPQFMLVTCAGFLQGINRASLATLMVAMALPINIGFNYLFIFGRFGLPMLGAAGAALGTLLADVIAVLLLLAAIHFRIDHRHFGIPDNWLWKGWRGAWRSGSALRSFGIAPGIASGFENAGFSILTGIAGTLGTIVAAAFQDVVAALVICLAFAFGLSTATGVRVGVAVGARDPQAVVRRGWLACGATVLALAPFLVIASFWPGLIIGLMTDNPEQRAVGAMMLGIIAPFIFCDGCQFVLLFALRAAGDQKVAALVQISGYFLTMATSVYLLVYQFHLGAAGISWGMGIGMATTFLLMASRFFLVSGDPPALRSLARDA